MAPEYYWPVITCLGCVTVCRKCHARGPFSPRLDPWPPPTPGGAGRLSFALLLGAYAAGVGAVLFASDGTPVATFWPASAFAVTVLALAPRRRWLALVPAVFVVSVPTNVTGGRTVDISLGFGVANTAEAVVGGADPHGRAHPSATADVPGGRAAAARRGRSRCHRDRPDRGSGRRRGGHRHLPADPACNRRVTRRRSRHVAAGGPGPRPALLPVDTRAQRAADGAGRADDADLLADRDADHRPAAARGPLLGRAPAGHQGALPRAGRVRDHRLAAHRPGPGPVRRRHRRGRGRRCWPPGAAAQLFLLCTAIITLPLAVSALQSHLLLDRVRADELLFRRNFTESLVGMVFLAVEEVRTPPAPRTERTRRASTYGSWTSTRPRSRSSAVTGTSSSTPRCSSSSSSATTSVRRSSRRSRASATGGRRRSP